MRGCIHIKHILYDSSLHLTVFFLVNNLGFSAFIALTGIKVEDDIYIFHFSRTFCQTQTTTALWICVSTFQMLISGSPWLSLESNVSALTWRLSRGWWECCSLWRHWVKPDSLRLILGASEFIKYHKIAEILFSSLNPIWFALKTRWFKFMN